MEIGTLLEMHEQIWTVGNISGKVQNHYNLIVVESGVSLNIENNFFII